jgi:hypothetical protein
MGTKIQHPHPPPKEKKPSPPMHVASTPWLQEFFLHTYILCHFWPRLIVGTKQWVNITTKPKSSNILDESWFFRLMVCQTLH